MAKREEKARKKSQAFSLIELSVVVLILSFIATGLISFWQVQNSQKALRNTQAKMQKIEDALLLFLAVNGRLPCPASPFQQTDTLTFGYEKINTSVQPASCNTAGTGIFTGSLGGSEVQYYGTVPVRSLGLDDSTIFDGWNNRFGYVVTKAFINNSITNPSCIADGSLALDDHSNNQYFCFKGQASNNNSSATIDLQIRNNFNGTIVSNNPVYVVISHGPNGFGAFTSYADVNVDSSGSNGPNADQNSYPPSGNSNESINLNCNSAGSCTTSGLTPQYIQTVKSRTFDDIIAYKERNTMLLDCNRYFNKQCTNSFGIEAK